MERRERAIKKSLRSFGVQLHLVRTIRIIAETTETAAVAAAVGDDCSDGGGGGGKGTAENSITDGRRRHSSGVGGREGVHWFNN